MTGREKIRAALEHLRARGVKPLVAAPVGWRLAWRLGILIPPPLFLGFLPLALLTGLAFALPLVLFGVLFLALIGAPVNWPLAVMGAVGGATFGLINAGGTRWKAARLGLPLWAEFDPAADPGDPADDAW